jgi:hypothetical protein
MEMQMPTVTLSADDLTNLSAAARAEIAALLSASSSTAVENPETSEWFPVPSAIIKRFMSGVADQSKELLRLLAQHNGEIKWSRLREELSRYKEWQDLKGFQAGMNRRLRGFVDDPHATFVSWDESRVEYDKNDEPMDGYLKVHSETAKSLREYFGMA